MEWKNSLTALKESGIAGNLTHLDSRTSSVTTSWGVNWDENYIARDLMQNFFDANRERLGDVQVLVHGNTVEITAPAEFELARLFYLGSEKGGDDVGQYGEGFKAAAVCLLRDHNIEPIVISGDQVVYLRIENQKVAGTQLQPVIYDFFRTSEAFGGARMILRGCSKSLIVALKNGLAHFFYEHNPILGSKLWSSWDGAFAAYASTTDSGHVFYQRLKRGEIPDIPVVLVINKSFERIEKKIRSDRDRNAFGGALMDVFYQIFARSGVRSNQAGEMAIVTAARNSWIRGHPLLSQIAESGPHRTGSWQPEAVKKVFGDGYYAVCTSQQQAEALEFDHLERKWREQGRKALPGYFKRFGVLNADAHSAELRRKAMEEEKTRHHRPLLRTEQLALSVLGEAVRNLAPAIMQHFDKNRTTYSVAETETILGQLKKSRGYREREVFLSSQVFISDFAEALAIFLHEHAHIFGYDGSRGFTDCLTEMLETVVRERSQIDQFEVKWEHTRSQVILERKTSLEPNREPTHDMKLESMSAEQLRELLRRLPSSAVRRAMEPIREK
jgi:hypothetical protein